MIAFFCADLITLSEHARARRTLLLHEMVGEEAGVEDVRVMCLHHFFRGDESSVRAYAARRRVSRFSHLRICHGNTHGSDRRRCFGCVVVSAATRPSYRAFPCHILITDYSIVHLAVVTTIAFPHNYPASDERRPPSRGKGASSLSRPIFKSILLLHHPYPSPKSLSIQTTSQ